MIFCLFVCFPHRNAQHGIRTSPILSSTSEHRLHHHDSSYDMSSLTSQQQQQQQDDNQDVNFIPIIKIRDQQAIRTGEFHPNGNYYAIGSNSKLLRIFHYEPSLQSKSEKDGNQLDQRFINGFFLFMTNNDSFFSNLNFSNSHELIEPDEIYARTNYHKGSIYWSVMCFMLQFCSFIKFRVFSLHTVWHGINWEIYWQLVPMIKRLKYCHSIRTRQHFQRMKSI